MGRTEVVVTRRGQTTIPVSLRRKLGIVEGTKLEVSTRGEQIVFRKAKSTFDLAGSSKLGREDAFRLLDKMRSEE